MKEGYPAKHDTLNNPPLINEATGEVIERNRPGSPYLKLDTNNDNVVYMFEAYLADLDARLEEETETKLPYAAPEELPLSADIESTLAEKLIREGTLNIWDASIEVANEHGGKVSASSFKASIDSLVWRLGLEVKITEDQTVNN